MAKKEISNQWRSGPLLHHTRIPISADTPMEKVDQLKDGIIEQIRVRSQIFVGLPGGGLFLYEVLLFEIQSQVPKAILF